MQFYLGREVSFHKRVAGSIGSLLYFPVQIALTSFVGLVIPRFLRHWLMKWVWVLPFLILCVSFLLTPLPIVDRIERYFGWGCRPELGCVVQLAVTLPF